MPYLVHFVKYSYSCFIFFLLVGVNAKPIAYTTLGIYRSTSTTVQTGLNNSGWLCEDYFTANDAQVVCLIWGFLP